MNPSLFTPSCLQSPAAREAALARLQQWQQQLQAQTRQGQLPADYARTQTLLAACEAALALLRSSPSLPPPPGASPWPPSRPSAPATA
jgi:hypothetical protein